MNGVCRTEAEARISCESLPPRDALLPQKLGHSSRREGKKGDTAGGVAEASRLARLRVRHINELEEATTTPHAMPGTSQSTELGVLSVLGILTWMYLRRTLVCTVVWE